MTWRDRLPAWMMREEREVGGGGRWEPARMLDGGVGERYYLRRILVICITENKLPLLI